LLVGGFLSAFAPTWAAADCPDLDLVLAIDTSGSVSAAEFELQKQGYAMAFADPAVQAAIRAAGKVDVAVVFWGDDYSSVQVIGWRNVTEPKGAGGLAHAIAATPRQTSGDTGIGRAVWVALDILDASGRCAARRVINVSGDGRESVGPRRRPQVSMAVARERARATAVTINGLAILSDEPGLAEWYRGAVVVGPDAFVMEATGYDSFAQAIARKLAREIAPAALAGATGGSAVAGAEVGQMDEGA
jgi:hypothetical protein